MIQAVAIDLDHIGTAVRDLDAAQAAFERLGFTLTPRSYHRGAATPGGPVEPWGSANHCAMLAQGYLEILGIVDDSKFSSARALLAKYEGPHIVAFRPDSAESVQHLIDRKLPVDIVRNLERTIPFGPEGNESRRVAFRNTRFSSATFPEAQFQYTEHLTREAMWQPHLLVHPNGATALDCVYLCSVDPQALIAKLSPVLGVSPRTGEAGEFVFDFAASSLCVLTPEAWQRRSNEAPRHALPAPVGYSVRTSSLATAEAVLTRNAIPYTRSRDGLYVGTGHACGNVIHFIERNPS
jgi:hypothetical protein